jgi:hypothetical protein
MGVDAGIKTLIYRVFLSHKCIVAGLFMAVMPE